MNTNEFISAYCKEWIDHIFFCGCEVCNTFKNEGLSVEISKKIMIALEFSHVMGGDAGGPYSDFKEEVWPDIVKIIKGDAKA
jgi:hypothetical protein